MYIVFGEKKIKFYNLMVGFYGVYIILNYWKIKKLLGWIFVGRDYLYLNGRLLSFID